MRRRTNQQLVYHSEHHGIRADSECQGSGCGDEQCRSLCRAAHGVSQVLEERQERLPPSMFVLASPIQRFELRSAGVNIAVVAPSAGPGVLLGDATPSEI